MTPFATYAILAFAIAAEVAGTSLLGLSQQFTRLWPTLGLALCYGFSFYCLSVVVRHLPIGIVYAVWSGMGIVLIAGVGYVLFRQTLDTWAVVGLGLILSGVVVINTLSSSVQH